MGKEAKHQAKGPEQQFELRQSVISWHIIKGSEPLKDCRGDGYVQVWKSGEIKCNKCGSPLDPFQAPVPS